jgi:mycothiol synthase
LSQSHSGQSVLTNEHSGEIEWEIRPYKEGDRTAIVALINTVDAAYKLNEGTSEEELRIWHESPRSDPPRQIVVVTGPRVEGVPPDMLLGTGRVQYDDDEQGSERIYYLSMSIHPVVEGKGLERVIARRLVEIAHGYEREPNMPQFEKVTVKAYTREELGHIRALFDQMGLKQVRRFWVMERSLHDPIDEPPVIEGVHIRVCNHPEDNRCAMDAFNDSFADHYDFHTVPEEDWTHWISTPFMRHDLSWLAEEIERPGKIAGFCICGISEPQNKRKGVCEGWIELLGTTRAWRRKGLGRALLLHGLHSLRSAGMDTALLGVDSESLTGANRLYESVGFRIRSREAQYECGLSEIEV